MFGDHLNLKKAHEMPLYITQSSAEREKYYGHISRERCFKIQRGMCFVEVGQLVASDG